MLNGTIAEKYIKIFDKKSFFEYNKMINWGRE